MLMKNFYNKNIIYIVLFFATISTLIVAIIEHYNNNEFVSSIFCNLFAGMITGCVIAVISAVKNRRKSRYILLISAYKSVFDCNMEFINNDKYYSCISDYSALYEELYKKLSFLKFINEYIEKYKNEFLKEGELATIFNHKFSYNVKDKENEYIKLKNELQANLYNSKKDLLDLVRKYEIDIIRLNAKIMMEINKCKSEIYVIDQSFI